METNFYGEIITVLSQSGLSDPDQQMWLRVLFGKPEFMQILFIDTFFEDKNLLLDATENLRLKISAKGKDSVWEEVSKQERAMLLKSMHQE